MQQIKNIRLEELLVDGNEARAKKSQSLQELADSIKAHGVLQPIIVGPAPPGTNRLVIIAGRRRHAAAALAGLEEIPCIVTGASDQAAAEISVIENLQREDLAPLEEASEIQKLIDRGWEVKDVADHIGKSPTWVVRRGNLTKLSKEWRKALADPKHREHNVVSRWPAGWLELVARLAEKEQNTILEDIWDVGNRHALEVMCLGEDLLLAKAPWKKDDGTLVPEVGACDQCTKRSSHRPGLFDEWGLDPKAIKKTDKCMEQSCWEKKAAVYVERREVELREKHGDVIRVKDHHNTKDALDSHAIKKLNKKAAGAKPCIMVDGPNAGQVFYGEKQSWARSSSTSSASAGKKKGPTPLKERKKALDKRREALVNRWLREKLADKDYPKMAVGRYSGTDLLRHLVAFGTDENCDYTYKGNPWIAIEKLVNTVKKSGYEAGPLEQKLWRSVFKVMESRLHHNGNPPAKEHELLCKHHGDLLNVTIKNLRKKAAEELPDPKSWAGLNADGTPKKSKATKAIKKACRQKPATKSQAKSPTESRTKSQVAKGIKACKVKGCEMPAYTHGMCSTHFVDWASKTKKGGKKK